MKGQRNGHNANEQKRDQSTRNTGKGKNEIDDTKCPIQGTKSSC